MIDLQIRGLNQLLQRVASGTRRQVMADGITQAAFHLQGWIQRERLTGPRPKYLGVVTGRLRSSIAVRRAVVEADRIWAKIGTNVEYGPIHEFGDRDRNIRPRPFLRPAITERKNANDVLKILTDNIKRHMGI